VPFVGLALRTLTPGGEEATTNLRLSLPEFRVRTLHHSFWLCSAQS
jgi:hypothetical protein